MKILITTFIIFNLSISTSAQGWFWQNPKPTGNDIKDIEFFESGRMICVDDVGFIIISKDSGNSWQSSRHSINSLNSIYFVNSNEGWIVGNSGKILKTEDSGDNWTEIYSKFKFHLRSVYFLNSELGWIAGDNDTILLSTNGGTEWLAQIINLPHPYIGQLNTIQFLNDTCGYVGGPSGIHKTCDGGMTWEDISPQFGFTYRSIYFINDSCGWAVGIHYDIMDNFGIIINTTNGGDEWTLQISHGGHLINSVYFTTAMVGWAVGWGYNGNLILKTTDAGANWMYNAQIHNNGWNSIKFINGEQGCVVGDNGSILNTKNSGISWLPLRSEITPYWLGGVFFSSPELGWIVGANDLFITTDGGISWLNKPFSPLDISAVYFLSDTLGYLVGSRIWKSTDGGIHWSIIYSGGGGKHCTHFLSENLGWVAGSESYYSNGKILKTTDGGLSWNSKVFTNTSPFRAIHFNSEYHGGCVSREKIFITTDGGNSWSYQSNPTISDWMRSICFVSDSVGWIVGESGLLLKTINGGLNWEIQPSPTSNELNRVFFLSHELGWIAGRNGTLLKTTDGGNNWDKQETGTNKDLSSCIFLTESIGWIIGEHGVIMKTTNGGITFLEENISQTNPTDFILPQNYPNPFNPSTTISYSIPKTSYVNLTIYDLLGRQIKNLVNEQKPSGNYEIEFDATSAAGVLSSGIYFYRIETIGIDGSKDSDVKKMILMK